MNLKRLTKRHTVRIVLLLAISVITILVAASIGSAGIGLRDEVQILADTLLGRPLSGQLNLISANILLNVRLPRVLTAFLVGMGLAISGTVMQSILKNPLASSYTLGVSSGASLGAAAVMMTGISIPLLKSLTMSFVGFLTGLLTVFLVIMFTYKLQQNLENQTIILVGMVVSLFMSAILTVFISLAQDHLEQIVFWQMGSFSGKGWDKVWLLLPVVVFVIFLLMGFHRELDVMTLGEEEAMTVGVDVKQVKLATISLATLLTALSVSIAGVIGFVDLIAPHVVRKFFGASHQWVLPASALFGGVLCVWADLVARVVLDARELPVGAVMALIGAPFFCYVYFSKQK